MLMRMKSLINKNKRATKRTKEMCLFIDTAQSSQCKNVNKLRIF